MSNFTKDQINIEKKEYEILKKINIIIKSQSEQFNSGLANSLKFIEYLTLPLVMSSNPQKAYNPFADIIERHFTYIINYQMRTSNFLITPLGYSSDLCFEGDDCIIHIDIKTANLKNTSDYVNNIALGFNQISYPGKLPINVKLVNKNKKIISEKLRTFPYLPTEYYLGNKSKLCLTYGLLIVYPDYGDLIKKMNHDYENIFTLISSKVKAIIIEQIKEVINNYQDQYIKNIQIDTFTENAIRGYILHKAKQFDLTAEELEEINTFENRLKDIANNLKEISIEPIAIISVSIPNGKLTPHYDDNFVSGKNYGQSVRYHYENGHFKGLTNSSRVIFIQHNKNYLDILKTYFNKIIQFEMVENEI